VPPGVDPVPESTGPSATTWLTLVTVITLVGVAAILLLSSSQWLQSSFDAEAVGQWIDSKGLSGVLAFAIGGALLTSIGLPRQLVALCAGYALSVLAGAALAIISVSCGALLTFTFSRYFARPWVQRNYPNATQKVDAFVGDQAFLKIVTIRFAPIGTNMLTNLAAGTTALPASVFFIASAIGFLPQTLVFVLIGNGLAINSQQQVLAAIILGIVSLLLCWLIYRRSGQK